MTNGITLFEFLLRQPVQEFDNHGTLVRFSRLDVFYGCKIFYVMSGQE